LARESGILLEDGGREEFSYFLHPLLSLCQRKTLWPIFSDTLSPTGSQMPALFHPEPQTPWTVAKAKTGEEQIQLPSCPRAIFTLGLTESLAQAEPMAKLFL
jgi:hypothetical protein